MSCGKAVSLVSLHLAFSTSQTNIIAVRDGEVKDVFYSDGDTVPVFSKVVEYSEDEQP